MGIKGGEGVSSAELEFPLSALGGIVLGLSVFAVASAHDTRLPVASPLRGGVASYGDSGRLLPPRVGLTGGRVSEGSPLRDVLAARTTTVPGIIMGVLVMALGGVRGDIAVIRGVKGGVGITVRGKGGEEVGGI